MSAQPPPAATQPPKEPEKPKKKVKEIKPPKWTKEVRSHTI